jgi:hypothetical protein
MLVYIVLQLRYSSLIVLQMLVLIRLIYCRPIRRGARKCLMGLRKGAEELEEIYEILKKKKNLFFIIKINFSFFLKK